MSYYYLLASLPMLLFYKQPGIDSKHFLASCLEQCPQDYPLVCSAVLKTELEYYGNSFLDSWSEFDYSIAVQLAAYRKKKVSFGSTVKIPQISSDKGWLVVKQMIAAANPGEAEKILDKARWDYIEELEKNHFFELDNLLAYALKLKILERRFSMTEEKGRKAYTDIFENQKALYKDVELNHE